MAPGVFKDVLYIVDFEGFILGPWGVLKVVLYHVELKEFSLAPGVFEVVLDHVEFEGIIIGPWGV